MDFEYRGRRWLRQGFRHEGLLQYIDKTREKLRQPLKVPSYATANEEERLKKLSEKQKKDPYARRAAINEAVKLQNESLTGVQSISFGEYPLLYDICVFAARQLMDTAPMVFLYSTEDQPLQYNAFALDHQEKAWIYISRQLLNEHGMLREEELAAMVGHELGHAQCHHYGLNGLFSSNTDLEYSADRAGMIVCTKWILRKESEMAPEEAARLAVEYSISLHRKLFLGVQNGPGKVKWDEFDHGAVREAVSSLAKTPEFKRTADRAERNRIMAMHLFSQSWLFYRCLGITPGEEQELYTDQQLRHIMAYQLNLG